MPGKDITTLYKYKELTKKSLAHFEDMTRNNRIWFSSPLQFNDPFDCRRMYDTDNTREEIVFRKASVIAKHKNIPIKEAFSKANEEIPIKACDLEKWQERQLEWHSHRLANTGILCFSAVHDHFIMWTHYAKNHTGICFAISVQDTDAEDQINFIAKAQPVEYSDRCPVINFVQDSAMEIVRKVFFTKASPFRYEQEWRIVEYDKKAGLRSIPRGIISKVFLGCNIEKTAKERVINACIDYDGKIEIVQAELDPKTYGLKMIPEKIV